MVLAAHPAGNQAPEDVVKLSVEGPLVHQFVNPHDGTRFQIFFPNSLPCCSGPRRRSYFANIVVRNKEQKPRDVLNPVDNVVGEETSSPTTTDGRTNENYPVASLPPHLVTLLELPNDNFDPLAELAEISPARPPITQPAEDPLSCHLNVLAVQPSNFLDEHDSQFVEHRRRLNSHLVGDPDIIVRERFPFLLAKTLQKLNVNAVQFV
mmetsp:Transcript_21190/g.44149  ORF Transcript_21190/g.44149 Transcript_21190/m.44149 type:complete len:208 (-) Transcript_21190:2524-3147(-)